MNELEELCRRLEHFETPEWAVKAILKKEVVSGIVYDPCCGTGVLLEAARLYSEHLFGSDIHDWGYKDTIIVDFLNKETPPKLDNTTIFMNPPFSLAEKFVEKSIEIGVRKIICFQRFAWLESQKRREFWEKFPPARVYVCGDRADCWRHDIPRDKRGSGTPTAHAWFVWEKGSPAGTLLGHIYKKDILK